MDLFRDGRLVERIDEPNLIVSGYAAVLAGLLGGGRVAPGITQFGVGTSMAAPAFGNTALTNAYRVPVGASSYPAPGQVAFAFALQPADAPGLSIGEFGLFAADGTLFARKVRTFSPILKDPSLSFQGTWTIAFP